MVDWFGSELEDCKRGAYEDERTRAQQLAAAVGSLRSEKEEGEEKLRQLEIDVATAGSRQEDTEQRTAELEAEVAALTRTLQEKEAVLGHLDADVAGHQGVLEAKETTIRQLAAGRHKALAKLTATVEKLKEIQKQSEAVVAEAEAKLAEKEGEVSKGREDHVRLRGALGNRDAELQKLKKAAEAWQAGAEEAEGLKEEVVLLEEEGGHLRDALRAKEGEVAAVREQLEEAKAGMVEKVGTSFS